MAARGGERVVAAQAAQDGDAGRQQGVPDLVLVPLAGHPVQDHAGDPHPGVVAGEAQHRGGHAATGAGHVHDEHDRRVDQPGDVCGRGHALGADRPVVQAHHTLDDRDVGGAGSERAVQEQRRHPVLALQHRIEVARRSAGGQRVVAGIDVVRPDLVPRDLEPATAQCRHQAGRDRGLPVPGARRSDDDAGHLEHRSMLPQGPVRRCGGTPASVASSPQQQVGHRAERLHRAGRPPEQLGSADLGPRPDARGHAARSTSGRARRHRAPPRRRAARGSGRSTSVCRPPDERSANRLDRRGAVRRSGSR